MAAVSMVTMVASLIRGMKMTDPYDEIALPSGKDEHTIDDGEDYRTIRTAVPPVLAIEDGRLVVRLVAGELTVIADVGDGRWFFNQVIARLVEPALLAQHEVTRFAAPND